MKNFKCIIVVLLMPISIFTLGVIYNSFKLNQFEWGNISDWVSALISFGALIVALMVYKAVPKLIHQKSDEFSFSIANKIIFDSIPDIIYNIRKLAAPFPDDFIFKIFFNYKEFIVLHNALKDNDSEITKLIITVNNLEKDLNSLRRLGWNFKDKQARFYELFLEKIHLFYSIYTSSSTRIFMWPWPDDASDEKYDEEQLKYSQDDLYKISHDVIEKSEEVMGILNSLLDSTTRVEDFFTRNTK